MMIKIRNIKPPTPEEILEKVGKNKKQIEAITAYKGNYLVVSWAGTGKTETIGLRNQYLISKYKVDPSKICNITFSNYDRKNLLRRVANEAITIRTFHSYAAYVLRQNGKKFNICSGSDTEAILEEVGETNMKDEIQRAKWAGKVIDCEYQKKLQACGLYDFDDLIIEATKCLEKHHYPMELLTVDEGHDINLAMWTFAKLIAPNIMVLIDPNQSMYCWRGSFPDIRDLMIKDLKPTVIEFVKDYRHTQAILDFAKQLALYPLGEIKSVKATGERPYLIHCRHEIEEADFIAKVIKSLMEVSGKTKLDNKDIAILVRDRSVLPMIEEFLIRHEVDYTLFTEMSYYDQPEVKAFINTLRYFDSKKSYYLNLIRSFDYSYNTRLVECRRPEEAINQLKGSKKAQKLVIRKLEALYNQYDTYPEFLDDVSLYEMRTITHRKGRVKGVSILTCHKAKGDGFKVVYVVGVEEENMPHYKCKDKKDIDEEQRILFVSCTRAEKILVMTYCDTRVFKDGRKRVCQTSRFLDKVSDLSMTLLTPTQKPLLPLLLG